MINYSPNPASSLPTVAIEWSLNTVRLLLFLLLPATVNASELTAYTAVYTSEKSGMSADMEQTFSKIGDSRWQLTNESSILFVDVNESCEFTVVNHQLRSQSYDYHNSFSSKRDSELRFNWENNTVIDQLHGKQALAIDAHTMDKLSFQTQLRLDLMAEEDNFQQQEYRLVDRVKLKDYVVTKLGEEKLQTKLGSFNTIKLEQRRKDRDEYTLIWMAKDWDYLVLRLQRIEDKKVEYQIDLKQASINHQTVKGH